MTVCRQDVDDGSGQDKMPLHFYIKNIEYGYACTEQDVSNVSVRSILQLQSERYMSGQHRMHLART